LSEQEIKNHAGLAAVFSFIFCGLGQLYNGQIRKGLVIIFFSALSILVLVFGSILIAFWMLGKLASGRVLVSGLLLFLAGLASICVLGIYSILDAYRNAAKK